MTFPLLSSYISSERPHPCIFDDWSDVFRFCWEAERSQSEGPAEMAGDESSVVGTAPKSYCAPPRAAAVDERLPLS